MKLDDSIVVYSQAKAQGVLGDLEPTIDVPPQHRREEEAHRKRQRRNPYLLEHACFVWGAGQCDHDLLRDLSLEPTAFGGEHASAIDGGVLVIDTRGNREGELQSRRLDLSMCEGDRR